MEEPKLPMWVEVIYEFTTTFPGELNLCVGDKVHLLELEARGWGKGEINKQKGWFPVTFTVPRKEEELPDGFSIIEEKSRIKNMLDGWLPTRINIHDEAPKLHLAANSNQKKIHILKSLVGKSARKPVFGVTLVELQRSGRDIPLAVFQCIAFLGKEENLRTDGIFRVTGNKDKANKIVNEFRDPNESVDFTKVAADVHSIASVLKRFFQELPEPLVPWEFGQPMIAIYNEHADSEDLINLHAGVINRMPSANSAVFKLLIKFLYSVTEHSSENQMTARNLGIVWGPTILRPPSDNAAAMVSINETCCLVVESLIKDWLKLETALTLVTE